MAGRTIEIECGGNRVACESLTICSSILPSRGDFDSCLALARLCLFSLIYKVTRKPF